MVFGERLAVSGERQLAGVVLVFSNNPKLLTDIVQTVFLRHFHLSFALLESAPLELLDQPSPNGAFPKSLG